MPPLLGVYVFTDRLAFAAADWCFRLHGWPLCRRCWASTSSPTGLPSPLPTGVSACTAGLYAAVVGRLRLHRPAASSAADWCFRLHGWPIMPPLLGVYVFTDRPPRPPPIGVFAYMVGWSHHRCWASTSSPIGLPSSPPTGVSACTAGLLCHRCWASTSSPTGRLVRRRLVFPPARLAYYATVVGRLRLHRPAASSAADWCLRLYSWLVTPPLLGVYVFTDRLAFVAADWCLLLHGWPIMPPLLGVYVFTDRPPRPPPTGVSACTAGLLCRRCWASTSSPTGLPSPPLTGVSACTAGLYAAVVGRLRLHRPACLRRCRLVFPPARLAFMLPLLGVYVFTDRPPRPPPIGVFAYMVGWSHHRCWASTSSPIGLPSSPPTGVSACTAGLLCHRCWASTSSPTGRLVRRRLVSSPIRLVGHTTVVGRLRLHRSACLRRRRLVSPPARLAYYATVVGRLRLHRPAASSAADWCFRLHGWPIMPPLLGVYVFTDRLAFAAADWCFRLHGWPLCRRCWASTSSPTGLPSPLPTGVSACTAGLYAAVVGRLRLHRPAASSAADWCFRLHGWPIMPPLLGVYVFTDRLAFAAADWCFRLHGWPLCRRCWASTSSPTGLPSPPPTGVSACTAGLLCRRCWASTSSPTGLPSSPPTGVSACTAGLLCHRCWASTSSPTGRLVSRRLVFPPARLAYYATVVGRLRLHRPAASSAADWCFRLHGWPIMLPLLGVYVFTDRPPRPPPTGASACTAGLYAAVVGRLRLHRPAASSAADWCFRLHGWPIMPPLLGVYVFTDRPPRPPPTGASACTAGLYAAVVGCLRLHRPAASTAADWCFRLHGWPIMLPLLGVYIFTDRPSHPPLTGVTACTAGLL
ncbi:Os05g0296398 [Oryza sativa Japonica Group]|uniref:cysteine dioxygenase n=1 Tax=Oryza sativa subsp. japonica TaxID=39947 RepID=A0A0P0WKB4_ORYSJ|nr:Os05g0296398 [Oryza sativa Japonica Group]